MYVKITTSGGRRDIQCVESYRDDAGWVKKRTVAMLGRLDQLDGELRISPGVWRCMDTDRGLEIARFHRTEAGISPYTACDWDVFQFWLN